MKETRLRGSTHRRRPRSVRDEVDLVVRTESLLQAPMQVRTSRPPTLVAARDWSRGVALVPPADEVVDEIVVQPETVTCRRGRHPTSGH